MLREDVSRMLKSRRGLALNPVGSNDELVSERDVGPLPMKRSPISPLRLATWP